MIQISELSQDDVKYICGQLPLPAVRGYFQKYPRDFAEIKKGFRPDKLTDAETIAILTRNISKRFISSFVEKTINTWLEEISEHRKKLVENGYSEGEALLKTIPDSVFCDNCELYFKLIEMGVDSLYVDLFKDSLSLIERKEDEDEDKKKIKTQAKEIEAKDTEIAEISESLESMRKKYVARSEELAKTEEEAKSYKTINADITAKLKDAENKISDMLSELERYRWLERYADSDYEDEKKYQHVSIGIIIHDSIGKTWINRLADIEDGKICTFNADEFQPKLFDNRERLWWRDGPDEDGKVGVWGWRSVPNKSDPLKDHVITEYQKYVYLTEVVDLSQCSSVNEIAKLLVEGVERSFTCDKVLFTCAGTGGIREGLLCYSSNFVSVGNKVRIIGSVGFLRKYEVEERDCIELAGKRVIRRINMGAPQGIVRLKTPYEVVKSLILKRVTVPALRDQELSKKEAQKCLGYLKSIPADAIVQEFIDEYDCNEEEAKEYIDGFMEHVESYLSGNDLDTSIILAAVNKNEELLAKCKELLRREWEEENSEKQKILLEKLEEIENEIEKRQRDYELLGENEKELVARIDGLSDQVSQREKLAHDVETKIADRINEAKKCAADFIAQMAFAAPCVSNGDMSEGRSNNGFRVRSIEEQYIDGGSITDIDTFEEELSDNLQRVGYEENASIEMAQAIRFCVSNRMPVIINENARGIAECLAGVLGTKDVKEYFVPLGEVNSELLLESLSMNIEKEEVILLHGVFDGYSNNLFNAIENILKEKQNRCCILISIQGIEPNMISYGVWSHSFYIDGESKLIGHQEEVLNSFALETELKVSVEMDAFKKSKKMMKRFESIIGNIAQNNYAEYLSLYGMEISESWLIRLQLIVSAQSKGNESELRELFQKNGMTL